MTYNFFTQLSLLSRFTLISFSATLLLAAGLASRLESTLKRDALEAVAENTADQALNSLDENLTATDLTDTLSEERYKEVDTLIHNTLLSANIVRIKIWNRSGQLIYANDQSIVGNTFPLSDELDQAFQGEIVTEISILDKEENVSERELYEKLFEIYVPIKPKGSDKVEGAYEVYYDLSKLQPRLTRIRTVVWSGVGTGFLLLYGALYLLIRNASRSLIKSNWENQRLLIAERKERELSETLVRVSLALIEILDLRKLLDLICRESTDLFKTQAAFLWLLKGGDLVGFAAHGVGSDQFIGLRVPIYDPHLLGARVARERKPIIVSNALQSTNVDQDLIKKFGIQSMIGIPLIKGQQVLGSLIIMDLENPQRFSDADLKPASVFGSHAALAIDNAQLFEQAQMHLQHEKALREIDLAITSNLDLGETLEVVLRQARIQLNIEACAILLFDNDTQTLIYTMSQGLQSEAIKHTRLRLGEGRVGNAILEQRIYGRAEIKSPHQIPERSDVLEAEKSQSYFILPLATKKKLLGALEIYNREPLKVSTEWLNFLDTLAGQAAIAIDNATLFNNLQQSNADLSHAYEATIEGWSAALDLRDKETEGHTQRVTEMTIRLAEKMRISEQDLVHIRRGALLHDIGKMGVPDRILLKADTLTGDEWEIMRRHPSYANQMLKSISYLAPALDIPYCHHEKWDGSGYPRGLIGEEIPLAARIFCIVDVYDALVSNRPYRAAWPKSDATKWIRGQSGIHFEPRVVDVFMKMMDEDAQ